MTTTSAEDPARAGAPSPDSERSLPPREKRGGTRELTWLAAPIVASQLSFTLMAAVDSVLVGRLGASELAAVGLANV